ncbi:hypothetical protein JCM17380_42340 [Desulfosporosinus burensis]
MAGKFEWHKFSEVDLDDCFFGSLKADYEEFPDWFKRKSDAGESTLVFHDEQCVGAFIYLKRENEAITLSDSTIRPAIPRVKIGTLRLAEPLSGYAAWRGSLRGFSLEMA